MTMLPPPPGFELDNRGVPPPPAGFVADGGVPPPPEGFALDGAPRPGIVDYTGEVLKGAGRGVAESVAGTLRGFGARDAATLPIMGQRLDESVAGAAMRGALPGVVQETPIPTPPASASPLFQAGEAVSAAAAEAMPSGGILNPVVEDVSQAVGNVAGNIGAFLVNPGLGVVSGLSQGVGEAAQRAVKAGATPEQQATASSAGMLAGVTEFADILLLTTGSVGKALGAIKRIGLGTLYAAATQGGQEYLQEVIQNAIEKHVYNPKKDYTEGAAYSFLIGALTGGGLGAAASARRPPEAVPPTPGDVGAAFGATVPPDTGPLLLPPPQPVVEPPPVNVGPMPLDPTTPTLLPPPRDFGDVEWTQVPSNVVSFDPKMAATRFGDLQVLDFDPGKGVTVSSPLLEGQLSADQVILHDNTRIEGVEPRSLTQLGVEKFGNRFYEFNFAVGAHFKALRDVAAGFGVGDPAVSIPVPGMPPPSYHRLRREIVGVSFDPEYRGVSIRWPFAVSLINPALTVYSDPLMAASGLVGTMIHELAHHHVRDHKASFPAAMQDIWTQLKTSQKFDFNRFERGLADAVVKYHDVMMWSRGQFEDGNVRPRIKRLGVAFSVDETGNGGVAGNVGTAAAGPRPADGSQLSDWVEASAQAAGAIPGRPDGGAKVAGSGDPSFGQRANQRALNAELGHRNVPAYQQTGGTGPPRAGINAAFAGNTPPPLRAAAAHADRINKFYQYMAGLLELGAANPRFTPLTRYIEITGLMHRDEAQIQDLGVKIAKDWRGLGTKQSDAVTRLFDDLANMVYLTPQERAMGVTRHPTPVEFAGLVAKRKVTQRGLDVYTRVKKFFDVFLDLVTDNAIADAQRHITTNPVQLADAIDEIRATAKMLRRKPYFPFMRFGSHFITVKDKNGHIEFFGLYERTGVRSAEKNQQRALAQLRRQFPSSEITHGVMPEDVRPMYGLPPTLLKHIQGRMKLTPAQQEALEQLQFELSPSLSFKHRFQHKSYVPGYSRDFIRGFSRYAFHGSRYYARTKYIWQLDEQIKAARDPNNTGGNKPTRIANYMDDHIQNTILDARGDYGIFKGLAFIWMMGFSPASAFINLTQTPMITFPHLATKFGDVRATAAITKAITQISNFYRKGSYGHLTDFRLRALSYGIRVGVVSETQAAELAGLANGNGLLFGAGGNAVQRTANWIQEKAALMFETAEQFNRRVAYVAALELAMDNQNAKYVNEVVTKRQTEYNNLINGVGTGGQVFTPQEARAIVTANDAVETTQFVYARYARPRFMRGRLPGTIFVFKRYVQAMVQLFFNGDKGYKLRFVLMYVLLAGLMGLPGAEELESIIGAVLKHFGHNVDPKVELRRLIKRLFNGDVPADMILHGMSRRGFGVPAALDAMGSYATGRPGRGLLMPGPGENAAVPILDFSKALTPKLSPVDIGKLIAPYQDVNKIISEQGQQGLGAVFSTGFNIYKSIMNHRMEAVEDTALPFSKRWEKSVPRQLGAMNKAFRTYTEGRERLPNAGPDSARSFLRYDVRDNEQLAEIIFQGMGFNTLRQSREWDLARATMEHKMFVEGTRKALFEHMFEAIKGEDPKERESVIEDIRKFNERVRGTADAGMAITRDALRQSMMTRQRQWALSEQGLPAQRGQIPMRREMEGLFPENVVDMRRR